MTETGLVPADRGLGVVGDLRTAALVGRNVVTLVARATGIECADYLDLASWSSDTGQRNRTASATKVSGTSVGNSE